MTDPVTALTVPDVLRRAEQVVAERGWCQGDFAHLGAVCARGAINVVVTGEAYEDDEYPHPLAVDATMALARYLNGLDVSDVSDWNDEPIRTEAEVRAALLAAAQRAEAGT